jgi:agmatine/peptidylarginine deiminase
MRRRQPAEWEPQQCVLLAWPHHDSDWAPLLDDVEAEYLELVAAILPRSPVMLCCRDEQHARRVRGLAEGRGFDLNRVTLSVVPYNDTWIRDYGPLSVLRNGEPELVDFAFNGWGGRHQAALDDRVSGALHRAGAFGSLPMFRCDRVLEGGSIDCDGHGTLLATSRCVLNTNRGAAALPVIMERELMTWLGAERILWLDCGEIAGDDTDGHIDMLARFCDEATIVFSTCEDERDANFGPLRQMHQQLSEFRRADGGVYRLVALPLPRPLRAPGGQRLPASYANFLIVNGAVIVPTYADPGDERALDILRQCFPRYDVFATRARALISQGGGVHCATMQLAARPKPGTQETS